MATITNKTAPTEMMEPDELSDLLKIPIQTLYQWSYRGRGPRAYKIGRHLRYRRDEVECWITSQAVSGPDHAA